MAPDDLESSNNVVHHLSTLIALTSRKDLGGIVVHVTAGFGALASLFVVGAEKLQGEKLM